MNLSALIRGGVSDEAAPAIPATFATHVPQESRAVAGIAKIAVASLPETKDEPSYWWRLHFADRKTREVFSPSGNTRKSILEAYPEAVSVEAFELKHTLPAAPMTESEAAAIRAWLVRVGETSLEAADNVLKQCQTSFEARAYYIKLAVPEDSRVVEQESGSYLASTIP